MRKLDPKIGHVNEPLRSIYMSDFRVHFCIKLVHFKEQKIIVCLVKLQAKCKIGLTCK